jgi:hypothetical protein
MGERKKEKESIDYINSNAFSLTSGLSVISFLSFLEEVKQDGK